MANLLWNEAAPQDTDSVGQGDDEIRSLKTSIRNGMAEEHIWPSASGGNFGVHLLGSARPYYVYWAAEYNAPVVHVMASDDGYAAIVNTGLPDLDEHRGDPGFLRSGDRRPPFNAYTSPAYDRQILASLGALWPGSPGGLATLASARSVGEGYGWVIGWL